MENDILIVGTYVQECNESFEYIPVSVLIEKDDVTCTVKDRVFVIPNKLKLSYNDSVLPRALLFFAVLTSQQFEVDIDRVRLINIEFKKGLSNV